MKVKLQRIPSAVRVASRVRALIVATGVVFAMVPIGVARGEVTAEQQEKIRAAMPDGPRVKVDKPRKLLVWSRSIGFQHSSIPHGAFATKVMGEKTGAWEATETTDIKMLLPENLSQFDGLVINNTTGPWITPLDADMQGRSDTKEAYEKVLRRSVLDFVAAGGGFEQSEVLGVARQLKSAESSADAVAEKSDAVVGDVNSAEPVDQASKLVEFR